MATPTFEPKIQEFLDKKKPGTKAIYTAGLAAFKEFYQPQGTIADFLDRFEADHNLGWRQTQHVAVNVITDYVAWLKERYRRKTVRAYTGAVQQLTKYCCDRTFSTRDCKLPASNPDLKKYSWTLESAVKFLDLFEIQMYRSFGVLIFQSFFDCSTTLQLEYRDIQKEYESEVVPLCLDTERFKTEIPFCSFIGKWGVAELHRYLDARVNLKPESKLFPVSEPSTIAYFRRRAEEFLGREFKPKERNTCGTHSLRASGSTLARNNIKGDDEHMRAVDRYLDFFMGKIVAEDRRVYMSKSREGWRETWRTCVEPFVTPCNSQVSMAKQPS